MGSHAAGMIGDKWQNTPLHYAAACGHVAAAEVLIAKGANVQLQDKYNRTPFDYAKKYKQKDMITYLKPLMEQREMVLNGPLTVGEHGGGSGDGLDGTRGF